MSGWAYDLPERLTRLISVDRVRRNRRFTRAPEMPGHVCFLSHLLPANVLDMVVGTHGQADASFQATAFQYLPSISRSHAFPETMNTDTPADARLVWSFGCHSNSLYTRFLTPTSFHCGLIKDEAVLYLRGWIRSNRIYPDFPILLHATLNRFR